MRGWGRSVKNAVSDWYLQKNADQLAYQLVKYQNRDGWSHRDVLKLAHPRTNDAIMAWTAAGGLDSLKDLSENWTRTPKAKKNGQQYIVTPKEIQQRRDQFYAAFDYL